MSTRQRAIELWNRDDLIALGQEADAVRKKLHPDDMVSYAKTSDDGVLEHLFARAQSVEERIDALEGICAQQQRVNFVAFRPLVEANSTGMEYVKTVALARICIDNIVHIQSDWRMFGLKVAQLALRFGANDLGTVGDGASEEELRRIIRDAGFVPKQRDALFRTYAVR